MEATNYNVDSAIYTGEPDFPEPPAEEVKLMFSSNFDYPCYLVKIPNNVQDLNLASDESSETSLDIEEVRKIEKRKKAAERQRKFRAKQTPEERLEKRRKYFLRNKMRAEEDPKYKADRRAKETLKCRKYWMKRYENESANERKKRLEAQALRSRENRKRKRTQLQNN